MTDEARPLVVLTGASGGIGRSVALRLAAEGYDLFCAFHSREPQIRNLQSEILSLGARCDTFKCDFTQSLSVHDLVTRVSYLLEDTQVQLRGLVNCAALLLGPSFETATEKSFDNYVAVNVRAPFFLTQQLAPLMAPGSSVVNFSSAGAHFSSPGDIVYSMSKAALESMTFHSAEALARKGIRINAVIPGFTDNGHELFSDPVVREHMESHAVLGDVSSPETVAEAVLFLISQRSSRTTGTTLDVSGGSTLGSRRSKEGISLRQRSFIDRQD